VDVLELDVLVLVEPLEELDELDESEDDEELVELPDESPLDVLEPESDELDAPPVDPLALPFDRESLR